MSAGGNGAPLGTVLLALGYPVAVAVLVRLRSVLRNRRLGWFAALELGTAAVATGWALRRRPSAAVVNALFVIGFAGIWWFTTRHRADNPG